MARFMLTRCRSPDTLLRCAPSPRRWSPAGTTCAFYTGAAFRERVESTGREVRSVAGRTRLRRERHAGDVPPAASARRDRSAADQRPGRVHQDRARSGRRSRRRSGSASRGTRWPGDEVSVGTALYAERTGCPWATVALMPLNMVGTAGAAERHGAGAGAQSADESCGMPRSAPPCRSLRPRCAGRSRRPEHERRAAAVEAERSTEWSSRRDWWSPAASRALDYERTDRPPVAALRRRAAVPDRGDRMPPWWGDLDGRRVVHVTQGTQNIDPADLIRPALEALADRDVLVVVATGVRRSRRAAIPGAAERPRRRVPAIRRAASAHRRRRHQRRLGRRARGAGHGIPLVIAGGDLDKPEIAGARGVGGCGHQPQDRHPDVGEGRGGLRPRARRRRRSGMPRPASARSSARGRAARAAELLESLV